MHGKKQEKERQKKDYVIEFEKNLAYNLRLLHHELKYFYYKPKPLVIFILRDPKIRKISKSNFRDRIVHHALVRVIEPIFDKTFIYDSCANRKGKGSMFALKRFELFKRKATNNLKKEAYCLKADIKHYFQEVNHEILINLIKRRIKDNRVIWLIEKILANSVSENPKGRQKEEPLTASSNLSQIKGMPLGNLTSQFFANVYLSEFDYFAKHKLMVRYYIRYVDDFVILHLSKEQLEIWRDKIDVFLGDRLMLELHPNKTKITSLSHGIDFVGFRNFYYHRLLRKRNIKDMERKINKFADREISNDKIADVFQGWNAYSKWADSYKLRKEMSKLINIHSLPI